MWVGGWVSERRVLHHVIFPHAAIKRYTLTAGVVPTHAHTLTYMAHKRVRRNAYPHTLTLHAQTGTEYKHANTY